MAKIDWHAGFVPAMKLELIENENDLVFEEEHPVDKRGNWIDLLIIVTSRLPDEYVWLKLLTDKATKARVKSLITGTEALQDPRHKEYADRIANTFVSANSDYINKLNEEEPTMCEAVELLFAEKHKQEMAEMNAKLSEKDAQISKQSEQISKKDAQISHLKETIAKLQSQIAMM